MTDKTEKPWDGHTELPWKYNEHIDGDEVIGYYVEGGNGHEVSYWDEDDKPRTKADAALISYRVNKGPAADAMASLIETLLENDPSEPISDAGHCVLDLWRHEARQALAAYRETDK